MEFGKRHDTYRLLPAPTCCGLATGKLVWLILALTLRPYCLLAVLRPKSITPVSPQQVHKGKGQGCLASSRQYGNVSPPRRRRSRQQVRCGVFELVTYSLKIYLSVCGTADSSSVNEWPFTSICFYRTFSTVSAGFFTTQSFLWTPQSCDVIRSVGSFFICIHRKR